MIWPPLTFHFYKCAPYCNILLNGWAGRKLGGFKNQCYRISTRKQSAWWRRKTGSKSDETSTHPCLVSRSTVSQLIIIIDCKSWISIIFQIFPNSHLYTSDRNADGAAARWEFGQLIFAFVCARTVVEGTEVLQELERCCVCTIYRL